MRERFCHILLLRNLRNYICILHKHKGSLLFSCFVCFSCLIVLFCFVFQRDRVSLCNPRCPGTPSVGYAGLKLTLPSASLVLTLKSWPVSLPTTPSPKPCFQAQKYSVEVPLSEWATACYAVSLVFHTRDWAA